MIHELLLLFTVPDATSTRNDSELMNNSLTGQQVAQPFAGRCLKCQIIRYFLAFASLCFSKKHIYTVDELRNCIHRLTIVFTIVFTFVLEIFVNDDDLDQTLSELPDAVDVHVGQTSQAVPRLSDTTIYGQTSEPNPGTGEFF